MILNNLDLWIPAPLCTDLTEEQRNLGLVVRQGGCWTRSMSVWFPGFPSYILTFFSCWGNTSWTSLVNELHAIFWTSVSILMFLLLKRAFMYVLMSVFWGENYDILHQKKKLIRKYITKSNYSVSWLTVTKLSVWACKDLFILHETPYLNDRTRCKISGSFPQENLLWTWPHRGWAYILFDSEEHTSAYLPGYPFW